VPLLRRSSVDWLSALQPLTASPKTPKQWHPAPRNMDTTEICDRLHLHMCSCDNRATWQELFEATRLCSCGILGMIINCPVCGGQLTITPQHFGQNVNCPHCTRVFQIPAAAPQATPQTPQQPAYPAPQQPAYPAAPSAPTASPVPPHLQQQPSAGPQPSPYGQPAPYGQAAPAQAPAGQGVPDEEASEALSRYREKRDKATSATIIWVIVVAVGVPAMIGLVALLFIVDKSSERSQKENREARIRRTKAVQSARSNLKVRGYTVQSDSIKVSGGKKDAVVRRVAKKGDTEYPFECRFRVTEASEQYVLVPELIEIDGEVVFQN